jgi:hypothetical protein
MITFRALNRIADNSQVKRAVLRLTLNQAPPLQRGDVLRHGRSRLHAESAANLGIRWSTTTLRDELLDEPQDFVLSLSSWKHQSPDAPTAEAFTVSTSVFAANELTAVFRDDCLPAGGAGFDAFGRDVRLLITSRTIRRLSSSNAVNNAMILASGPILFAMLVPFGFVVLELGRYTSTSTQNRN